MKLQTQIPITEAENQIGYKSQLLLLGSCFSENIGGKLEHFKFPSLQNPFGILFHPKAIENLVERAIHRKEFTEEELIFLNDRWHCFDAHSDLSDPSKENLLQKLNRALEDTGTQLSKTTHLVITLGTAWVYRAKKSKAIVANCHKVPQKEFNKELLSVSDITKSLEKTIGLIRSINKNIECILTVSPVRHLKDGFVGNQRSKAHLIAGIHHVTSSSGIVHRASYFPSYELMMDELRDYRFYEADMIHPNQVAIDYIWEKFEQTWISKKAHATMKQVDDIQKSLQHRPLHPDSEQHKQFLKALEQKITYLQQEHRFMVFER